MVDTAPKPFVFVVIPFDKKFDDVYQLGIKKACDDAGAYAERVDEQLFNEDILQRIYNQIAKADIIIADMTGRNENVFYETGYAHALGKHVILLTQKTDDIPFDLKHYPHILYGGKIVELIPELKKKVEWVIKEISKNGQPPREIVEFYIDEIPLRNNPTISLSPEKATYPTLWMKCHNPAEKNMESVDFRIHFLTSPRVNVREEERTEKEWKSSYAKMVELPNGQRIHKPDMRILLYPGDWEDFNVKFYIYPELPVGKVEEIILRMTSARGTFDYPFKLTVKEP